MTEIDETRWPDGHHHVLMTGQRASGIKVHVRWINSNYRDSGSAFMIIESTTGRRARACIMGRKRSHLDTIFSRLQTEPLRDLGNWLPDQEHFRSWHRNAKGEEEYTDIYSGTTREEMEAMLDG